MIQKISFPAPSREPVFIENPVDWWVVAWPYGDAVEKPANCFGAKDCICLCSSFKSSNPEKSLKKCNEHGVCLDVSGNVDVKENAIEIEKFMLLKFSLMGESVLIEGEIADASVKEDLQTKNHPLLDLGKI